MSGALRTWGVWVIWLGLHAALVQGAAAQEAQSEASAPNTNDDVARGLFQAGKAAYEAGDYPDALNFFEQAYARSARPQLLFNIGQVADRLRQDARAVEAFRKYLEQVPDAENRVEVESRIAAIEQAGQERETTSAPTPEQTARASSAAQPNDDAGHARADATPVTQKWWFWTSIGAAVLGGTVVALAVALGGSDSAGQEPAFVGNGGTLPGP